MSWFGIGRNTKSKKWTRPSEKVGPLLTRQSFEIVMAELIIVRDIGLIPISNARAIRLFIGLEIGNEKCMADLWREKSFFFFFFNPEK